MSSSGMYGDRAELYDAIYHFKDYAAEAERLHAILSAEGIADGASILEAACGTGTHLAHLRRWYDIAGFDLSEQMLAVARIKVQGAHLFAADMAELAVERSYDALLCLFSSIGYVHPEARLRKTAAAFARAVRPGGVVVVEPWLTDATFTGGHPSLQTYDSPTLKLARGTVSQKVGGMAIMEMHWLVMKRDAPAAEHFTELHEMWLCPTDLLLSIFVDSGFSARFEPDGLMRDRGLIIARRK
jgi:dTDP-3-amino-3,4,6-trideoxy-alpha-D-glucopyranose N,N-dimethyltransferase